MAEISDIRTKLATMTTTALASKNVSNVLTFYPKAITANMLPLVVVSVGGATYDMARVGAEELFEARTYTLVVFVADGMLGAMGEAEQGIHDYFRLLQDHFGAYRRVTVGAGSEAINITMTGDSGITAFGYADATYTGLRFDLRVDSDRNIPFLGE